MTFHRRAIAWFLASTLAFAGTVAFSPLLHHWIEHGGEGAPHVHGKFSRAHLHEPSAAPTKLFAHERPFDLPLPNLDLGRLWHGLAHWLAGHAADSSSEDESGHEHHSLSQLLAAGLLEQTLDFPALEQTVAFIAIPVLPSDDPLLDENWDAQSASRGPPFRRG